MTADEFRAIRLKLGLTVIQWGRALGYAGSDATVTTQIYRFEGGGGREIPETVARLAYMLGRHGVPRRFLKR